MKRLLLLLLSLQPLMSEDSPEAPSTLERNQIRAFLLEMEEAYHSDAGKAAEGFRKLLEQAPEGELNPDALKLAEGMALLKAEQPETALETLSEIEGFESEQLRGQLRHMKGNAHLHLAEKAVTEENWEEAKNQMEQAIESFTNVLREKADDEAARHNLEFAYKRLEQIKKMEPPPPEDQEQQEEQKQEEEQNEEEEKQQNQQQDQNQQDSGSEQEPKQEPEQEPDPESPSDPQSADEQENPQDQKEEDAGEPEGEPPPEPGEPGQPSHGDPQDANTELEARQMQQILDNALEQEEQIRRLIQQQKIRTVPVEKDW